MLCGIRKPVVGSPIQQCNVGAALSKTDGDALANSASSTRDNRDLTGEIEQLRSVQGDIEHRSSFLYLR
jgi:hypothetical protein